VTALTVLWASTASSTLSTANQLYTIVGAANSGFPFTETQYSSVGATGFFEVPSQGTGSAETGFGSIQSPTDKGFLLDSTILEGQTLQAGNYTPVVRLTSLSASAVPGGTSTADIILRLYKRSAAGVYTQIASCTFAAQSLTSTVTTYTFGATSAASMDFATGDKLYVDIWLNITANTAWGVRLNRLSNDTVTFNGDPNAEVTTPGYATTVAPTSYSPHKTIYIGRGIESTLVSVVALRYIGRGLASTLVAHYIPRGLLGTLVTPVPRVAVAGTLPGSGTLAGTFSLATALSVTLAGVGTLAGTVSLSTALTATLPGVGTLAGTLSLTTALAVTMPGVGTLTGTLSLATSLTSTLAGVGTLSGTLSLQTALSTTLAGVGTLSGTLSVGNNVALAVTMAGVGTLSGVFTLRVALSLTFAGMGTLAGTISLPVLAYLSATCVTRDMQAIARTRDMQAIAVTRDEKALATARDEQASATTRDMQATAKTRS
jgi:hypothetical protein